MSLQGKCALVTGSSRGIGRGIALKLAERGVAVAVNYLQDEASAQETVKRAREHGVKSFAVQADVSEPQAMARMFSRVRDEFGGLDIFVSNALGELEGNTPTDAARATRDQGTFPLKRHTDLLPLRSSPLLRLPRTPLEHESHVTTSRRRGHRRLCVACLPDGRMTYYRCIDR